MGFIKTDVNSLIRNFRNQDRASRNSIDEYVEMYRDRTNKTIEKMRPGDGLEPGKMFRFDYYPITKGMEWYDMNPHILSMGQMKYKNNTVEVGLNLNLLPLKIKVYIVDTIYHAFENMIEVEMRGNTSYEARQQRPLGFDVYGIEHILNTVYGKFAVRNYMRHRIRNLACISYEHWSNMLVINEFKFKNVNEGSLYRKYNEYINKIKKKKKNG